MRAWSRLLVILVLTTSTGTAFASSRKPAKDQFGDLFSSKPAKVQAKASKASKPAAKKAAPAAKANKPALVAEAAPAPQSQQMLILSDYAPNRHALAGP